MAFLNKLFSILIGSFLIAIGVNVFLVPSELLDGGTIGIGLVSHYVTGIQVGLVIIMVNTPIFIYSWFYNRSFFYNSLHGMLFSSFMIDLLYPLHSIGEQYHIPFVFAILGGITVGLGIGSMLWSNISVGGTDLLALMFARRRKLNPGMIIFIFDFMIVFTGSIIMSNGSLLLSCLAVICVGITTSLVSAVKQTE
ncbi:YitT family protein [Domibacillus sp. A3M-37]|uniref:YitT family protein n=1 Tax=Domibacillus sp. A3M-37 TaxID=2962037 RepID=UPI0020B6485D|nr:YitT family protein [Domibacillus sp. A3M-37]MCP3764116.1 YitT family protein [Domibacillus sp. A3M-37]